MKRSRIVALLLPSLLLCSSCIHAETRVDFLAPTAQVKTSNEQNNMMKQAIIKKFDLENSSSPFKSARIQVKSVSSNSETAAQIVLMYKDKYGVETYNVIFDKEYNILKSAKE